MDTTRLNLILSGPVIPKENILLIEGMHDLLAKAQPIEELWQKWQQPEIWRLPHGHITTLFVPGLTGTRASLAGTEVGSRSTKQRTIAPLAEFIDRCGVSPAESNSATAENRR